MMFTLLEGWFWCFFLEKKDILRDFKPKNGGMVGGGGGYGVVEVVLSTPLATVGRGAGWTRASWETFRLTPSRLTGRHRS